MLAINQYSFIKEHGRTQAQTTWNKYNEQNMQELKGGLSLSRNNCHVVKTQHAKNMDRKVDTSITSINYLLDKKHLSITYRVGQKNEPQMLYT